MSVADYGVLVQLSEEDGGRMRMSELADRLLLSPSGLTRRLDGLVSAGLVERTAVPPTGAAPSPCSPPRDGRAYAEPPPTTSSRCGATSSPN